MTSVFTRTVDRKVIHFTKHALHQWQRRVFPGRSRKDARAELKMRLDDGRVLTTRSVPRGLAPSRWSQARAVEWLVVDDKYAFPLNRTLDGTWFAPTCLIIGRWSR